MLDNEIRGIVAIVSAPPRLQLFEGVVAVSLNLRAGLRSVYVDELHPGITVLVGILYLGHVRGA